MLRLVASSFVSMLVCVVLAACGSADHLGSVQKLSGRTHITADALVNASLCAGSVQGGTISASCTLADGSTPGSRTSSIVVTGLGSGDTLQLMPFGVFQLPADASNFSGTYDNRRGTSGALRINPGLPSVRVDANTTLTAEPGMQLVIAELPPNAPPDTYFLVVGYDAASLAVKALGAVRVVAGGTAFIVPLVPCTSSFGSIPTITLPDTTVETRIDVAAVAVSYVGCSGKVYNYTASVLPATITVVEYYNRQLDHYFITWVPAEIAALDAGTTIRGWQRTGYTFKAYGAPATGLSGVCRFYIPPPLGDSHFFGRGTTECAQTGAKNPSFVLEDAGFFFIVLPGNGTCPASTIPVYRVFSNRPDANHRYMIDPAVRDAMVAAGWLAEGDGPNLVVMCAPA